MGKLSFLFSLLMFVWATPSQAATFNIAAGDTVGLINAITTANASPEEDTIILAGGTYTISDTIAGVPAANLVGNIGFPVLARNITFLGNGSIIERDPILTCTLDGSNDSSEFRIFAISSSTGTATFKDLTIRNGCADFSATNAGGGAIYTLIGNNTSVVLDNVTIKNNQALVGGGGILSWGPDFVIKNSKIINNIAGGGGGISLAGGTMTIANTEILNNIATNGGGIAAGNASTLDVDNSVLSGNNPAALWNANSITRITNSVIVGNISVVADGNGILFSAGSLAVENNWWGCNAGPNFFPCDRIRVLGAGSIDFDPWLVVSLDATPNPVKTSDLATITIDLAHNSDGELVISKAQEVFTNRSVTISASSNTNAHFVVFPLLGENSSPAGYLVLGMLFILPSLVGLRTLLRKGRPRRLWLPFVLILLIGLSGCDLLSGGLGTLVDSIEINTFQQAKLTAPMPGAVTISAQIDAELLTLIVNFVVETPLSVKNKMIRGES